MEVGNARSNYETKTFARGRAHHISGTQASIAAHHIDTAVVFPKRRGVHTCGAMGDLSRIVCCVLVFYVVLALGVTIGLHGYYTRPPPETDDPEVAAAVEFARLVGAEAMFATQLGSGRYTRARERDFVRAMRVFMENRTSIS